MKIKVQTSSGSFTAEIAEDGTLMDLKEEVMKVTNIDKKKMKLLSGYPPKSLKKDDTTKLQDCKIVSGDTIIVEIDNSPESDEVIHEVICPVIEKEDNNKSVILNLPTGSGFSANQGFVINEEICLICDEEVMLRVEVPSDNSCLFTCVYFITHAGFQEKKESDNLRKVIAEAIEREPETYNDAYLGRDNEEYQEWIMNPNSWGGAIELSIFSDYFKIEITCIDILSGAILRFGQDLYPLRGILIYDGIHYDPLVIECNHLHRTIFPVKEDRYINMALGIVQEARSSRQFTDMRNFKLKCGVCGLHLIGDKEARSHALETSHDEFGEII